MSRGQSRGRRKSASDHPPLTVAEDTAQGRRRVWILLSIALLGIAIPIAIGAYALRQAASTQRTLIESSRLAHADALGTNITRAVYELRRQVVALSQSEAAARALSSRDGAGALALLDAVRGDSTYFRALQFLDANDNVLATSPGDAAALFSGDSESIIGPGPEISLRRDSRDTAWTFRFTVRSVDGTRVGALVAALSLNRMLRSESPPALGRTGSASLVDRDGGVLASTSIDPARSQYRAPEVLAALESGERAIARHRSIARDRDEFTAVVPVLQAPFFLLLSQAADEVDAPLQMLEKWLWIGFVGLLLSSAAMFWHALRMFRHYDRRLIRECSLATGVIEGTSDMVFVKDSDARYLLVNEPAAQFLHHPKEDIVGHTVDDVMDADSAARTRSNDREVLDSGRPTKREFSGIDPVTGDPYVVWTARHPLRDREGTVAAVVGVTRIVTERHRLIDALRESEKRMRVIADNLPALMATFDCDERYLFANAKVTEVLGPGQPSPIGRTLREVCGEEIYANLVPHLAAVKRGELVTFEGRYAAGGRQHIHRTTYVPDVASDGTVSGFYGMTFDITDLKTIEMLLADSEARQRMIADNLPALVSYVDAERRFRFANLAHGRLLGITSAEMTGSRLQDVLPVELIGIFDAHYDVAFAGSTVDFEFTVPKRERIMRGTLIPDRNADDDVIGVYGLGYDITRHKKEETRLRLEAQFDPLTGLPNRRRLNEKLNEAIARSERYGHTIAVIYLDLDHLKRVNDKHGHAGGDLALKAFASRLSASVRATDLVARISGDEFVVILDGIDQTSDTETIARHIAEAVGAPFELFGIPCELSASMGIALRRAGETDADELLRRADHALYTIKASGRGRFLVAS